MIGDVGFDPLGLTEILPNLNYVREVCYTPASITSFAR